MGLQGLCSKCHRRIGGWWKQTPLWQCPTCRKVYCEACAPRKLGLINKKRMCPEDQIQMVEGGLKVR